MSWEESLRNPTTALKCQVAERADRMGLKDSDNIFLYSATRLRDILGQAVEVQPRAIIVDSIQTVYLDDVTGSAGSITQVLSITNLWPCIMRDFRQKDIKKSSQKS